MYCSRTVSARAPSATNWHHCTTVLFFDFFYVGGCGMLYIGGVGGGDKESWKSLSKNERVRMDVRTDVSVTQHGAWWLTVIIMCTTPTRRTSALLQNIISHRYGSFGWESRRHLLSSDSFLISFGIAAETARGCTRFSTCSILCLRYRNWNVHRCEENIS